jgi:hypothetical protein
MAGIPGRSGGHNRKAIDEHHLAGTFRPDRHLALTPPRPSAPVSAADRRRALRGLSGEARRITAALLTEYDGWNAATIEVLRAYALSSVRLAALQADPPEDTRALHREVRANLALLKALDLEAGR